ncbi:chemotaxis response regulator protein-glutamate methylesterase [Thiohalobacter sp. IOR34]|uniref:protein-glutamate methylesterase/protein-glutamine glutaminase n=1 Tax=Thiohalobacter sp. IOR34 TaxID=3057176 RepID=UPI0025B18CE6|nr:chemotaxis response regulator protein-glutamate methylesterase [Thiohalobacter sp. IOR34]WJW74555.1 chemotaxis response regulator protein-glutamate methylesterase [Thiohalobacter sp. IOR34]
MAVRVLVVDDSGFFRRRIVEILDADPAIEVVGTAADGLQAVQKVLELKPDVVTMDIEMPVMDGITAVRRIMAVRPTPVLMFSSLSYEGAKATLDALEAGAVDFLPKRFDEFAQDREAAKRLLCSRVLVVGRRGRGEVPAAPSAVRHPLSGPAPLAAPAGRGRVPQLVAIGCSTGGPVALLQVLKALPGDWPVPLLLIQHMPASFTPAFAQRLDQQCAIRVKEAEDGEPLEAGTAYLAPGGRQLTLSGRGGRYGLRVADGDPALHYRPSVDITFQSLARDFSGRVLALVLTGMGADGREGARALKARGAEIWAQDEASCVIFGMPGAIVEAGLADQVLPLSEIGPALARAVAGRPGVAGALATKN